MSPSSPFATAILLAGGSGKRMGGTATDKILLPLCRKPLLQYSIESFARSKAVDSIVVVYRDEEQRRQIEALVPQKGFRKVEWAQGGDKRQDSVWSGLSRLDSACEVVLIHDGARPFVGSESIDAVAQAALENGASCIARRATDTLKEAEYSERGYTLNTVDRSRIWAMETPQAFQKELIVAAYRETIANGIAITDDLSAIEPSKQPVSLVETGQLNPKLTTPEDLPLFEYLASRKGL